MYPNRMKTFIYSVIIFMLSMSSIFCQNSLSVQINLQHQDIPIDLDVGELQTIHHIIFRPYVSADLQYNFNPNGKKQSFLQAHIGYFYNQYNSRVIATNLGYGVRYKIGKRFSVVPSMELGIGFARDQTVQYTYENEKWIGRSTADILTYEFIAKTRLDLSYSINQKIDLVFTMHGSIISDEDLFAIPFYGLGLGVRYLL